MRQLKYILSIILAATVIQPSVGLADSQRFSDVDGDFWAKAEIEFLEEQGIISGYDDGTFRPNEPVKRSQAASMIVEALDLDTTNRPAANFTDIDEDFHAYDVAATVQDEGIIGGRDGKFMPNDPLTRGQMAAVLNRSFDFEAPSGTYNFADVDEEDTFYNDIIAIAEAGITTGYSSDNTFRMNNDTSRAQFSVFLARVLDPETFVKDDPNVPHTNLEAHFIDVGQGDSILLEYGEETMLIDGGKRNAGDDVVSYLKSEGIDSLDWVVATHPDADHIGGLIDVLNEFEVENVLDSGKEHTTDTYFEYLETIDAKDINFEIADEGEFIDFASNLETQVLHGREDSSDLNESSVVLKVSYGETDFMLTGDASDANEAEMIQEFDVEAEILKAGHHGSNTSTSQAFVNAVDPEAAVLSYGENGYGHPDDGIVDRLRSTGADIYSTDATEDIVITATPDSFTVSDNPWTGEGVGDNDSEPAPEPQPEPPHGKINVNTAGYEALQEITGVGPEIAQNIIEYREANGPFTSIEELDNVKYIGPATIEEMRPDITL